MQRMNTILGSLAIVNQNKLLYIEINKYVASTESEKKQKKKKKRKWPNNFPFIIFWAVDGKNGSKESIIYLGCHCEPKICTNLFSLILCMTSGGCFGNRRALEHQNSIFLSFSPSCSVLFCNNCTRHTKGGKKNQRKEELVSSSFSYCVIWTWNTHLVLSVY